MTLTIQETGIVHKCSNCRAKTLAVEHNGTLVTRSGRKTVMAPTLSIQCECGHWNMISVVQTEDVVD